MHEDLTVTKNYVIVLKYKSISLQNRV